MHHLIRCVALWLALCIPTGVTVAQLPTQLVNAAFEEGEVGATAPGWGFGGPSGSTLAIDDEGAFEGKQAARIDCKEPADSGRFAGLMQSLDAQPFRGKRVRFRAAVKTAGLAPAGAAQLWMRIDGAKDGGGMRRVAAFDNMDNRPIRGEAWAHYEIVLDVAADAEHIALGMFARGIGKAWIDDASFAVAEGDAAVTTSAPPPRTMPRIDPRVRQALADAEHAPAQPFWSAWLLLAAIAGALFVIGMWPRKRSAAVDTPPAEFGIARWFALRFTIVYWLLYCLPTPLQTLLAQIPDVGPRWSAKLGHWHDVFDATLAGWTARGLFGIEGELVPPNGSGDTTQSYLTVLDGVILAVLAAGVWTFLARRRPSRDASVDLLRSYLRYVLASAMLGYGLAKVTMLHNQFPVVNEWRLGRTWGETSPMGVVWAFMGSSRPYTIFGGLCEVLGAVLLLWRHTALLGALVSCAVMTNVAMLNYCYDVPVKLYSTHLLWMGVLIAIPDVRRLAALLVWNRSGSDPGTPSFWRGPVLRWLRWPLKATVLVFVFGLPLWRGAKEAFENLTKPVVETEAKPTEDDAPQRPLLTRRGYRWINEVPFNR